MKGCSFLSLNQPLLVSSVGSSFFLSQGLDLLSVFPKSYIVNLCLQSPPVKNVSMLKPVPS